MPDPVQIILTAAAGQIARRALQSFANTGLVKVPGPEEDVLWGIHDETYEEFAGIVTQAQLEDIEEFLSSETVRKLIQSWISVAATEAITVEEADLAVYDAILDGFLRAAEAWNRKGRTDWESLAPNLWSLITDSLDGVVQRLRTAVRETTSGRQFADQYFGAARLLNGRMASLPRHLRDIALIIADPQRLAKAPDIVADICNALERRYAEIELSHVNDDHRFELSQLYVPRTLTRPQSRAGESSHVETLQDHQLTDESTVSRAVIIGDPGAGKSTLVRHTIHRIASSPRPTSAPLLVQTRDYAANSWNDSILTFIRARLDVDFGLDIETESLSILFTFGLCTVVFDGVDEIVDLSHRREMIKRIEALANRYPFISIVCTSRRVGYAQARFREAFSVYELNEFTEEQFREYATRWFSLTERSDAERESFIRESDSVPDIRTNPLILSLLCTLYRARGHIPRNRRQVYRDCADLLFARWDAMRHIAQPYDHRQYGQRLMQELARFYFQSQSAQSGVEERQLVGIISSFFRDTASIDPPEDLERANQFLDFCAGRAWLLSALGHNSRGERLFAFTHRTFMEYLAAEALVRNATDVNEIVNTMISSFTVDPSSVVPDVMAQAADDKFDRGAEQVLRGLLATQGKKSEAYWDNFLSLCLRIVNMTPLSRRMSAALPEEVNNVWNILHVDATEKSTIAFFELYRDPRRWLVDSSRSEVEKVPKQVLIDDHLMVKICSRWARLDLLGMAPFFDDEWAEDALSLMEICAVRLRTCGREALRLTDPVLIDYMLYRGLLSKTNTKNWHHIVPAVVHRIFGNDVPGSAVLALRDLIYSADGQAELHKIEILDAFGGRLPRRIGFDEPRAWRLAAAMNDESRRWPRIEAAEVMDRLSSFPAAARVAVWLSFVLQEVRSPGFHPFHEAVDAIIGMEELERAADATGDGHERIELSDSTRDFLDQVGPWALRWIHGRGNLIPERKQSSQD